MSYSTHDLIYTGDIKRSRVSAQYDMGAVKMNIETAFLAELDSEEIFDQLKGKVEKNQLLSDEELMEFIVLPLSYHKKEEKQKKLREIVDLAAKIQNREQQIFALAGILVFTDKIIDMETANRIRRAIEVTQVAQIFEEEKRQEVEEVKRQAEKEKHQALSALQQQIAIEMIKKNYSVEEITSLVSGYTQADVEMLRKKISL